MDGDWSSCQPLCPFTTLLMYDPAYAVRDIFSVMLIYIRVYWKSVKCALRVTESCNFGRKTEYIVEKRSKLQYNKGGPETTVSG